MGKFKEMIEKIFMQDETAPEVVEVELEAEDVVNEIKDVVEDVVEIAVQNTEDIAEVKETLEDAPEMYTKAEVDSMVEEAVTATAEQMKLSEEGSKKDLKELKEQVDKLNLELMKPAKDAEVVIPPVGNKVEGKQWSMAAAAKGK